MTAYVQPTPNWFYPNNQVTYMPVVERVQQYTNPDHDRLVYLLNQLAEKLDRIEALLSSDRIAAGLSKRAPVEG
jgi:hypothetical protein